MGWIRDPEKFIPNPGVKKKHRIPELDPQNWKKSPVSHSTTKARKIIRSNNQFTKKKKNYPFTAQSQKKTLIQLTANQLTLGVFDL
jgi:hypothetical protein